jgi:hypothetical protein
LWLFILLGYVFGHFVQPISAIVVKSMEKKFGKEQKFAEYKKLQDKDPALIQLVTKAHAEAISMFSTALFAFGLFVYFGGIKNVSGAGWLLLLFLLLTGLAEERARARARKIGDLK